MTYPRKRCKACQGWMYTGQLETGVISPLTGNPLVQNIWRCANCDATAPRRVRRSKQKQTLEDMLKFLLNNDNHL